MRTALVHDWLVSMRGGEKVLEELCLLYPDSTIFTLFHRPGAVCARIESMQIKTSFLNRLPGAVRYYRYLLPILPWAMSRFDLRGYDLIISNSHAVAKGVRKPAGSIHLCSCLTPMRYIWDMQPDYFKYGDSLGLRKTALRAIQAPLRRWDRRSAAQVDAFIANSHNVRKRIRRCYDRAADVIYSPVDTDFFTPSSEQNGSECMFFLIVSALVSYKRLDIAVDAFNRLGYRLVIVGEGPDLSFLKSKAMPNIEFRGFESNEGLRTLYRTCAATIIPGREDFGLVALEAQACGRPAIAFAEGGSSETVTDESTGILFREQTPDSLVSAVRKFLRWRYDPAALRANAERFSCDRFRREMRTLVERKVAESETGEKRFLPAVRHAVSHKSLAGPQGWMKRSTDVCLSLLGLLMTGLPLLLLAALIRRNSPGPGFFRQTRVGLNGRRFRLYKLRTMRIDAEPEGCVSWTIRDDPRCTKLGNFLRRWGIDELPQLWNVLRGDMSIVGPRPERPEFHNLFGKSLASFPARVQVRGGMTGLAQIRGWRGDTSISKRLQCDLEYIERWSLPRDFFIILQTPWSLIKPDKERAPGWDLESSEPEAQEVPRARAPLAGRAAGIAVS